MESAELKSIITNYLAGFQDRITPAQPGRAREYPLTVCGYSYFADFAFHVDGTTWLFVEDDEGQTAPHNASKYWRWIEHNQITQSVHLLHIIGPSYGSYKQLAEFLSEKIKIAHPNFHYHQICTYNWDAAEWQNQFKSTVNSILQK